MVRGGGGGGGKEGRRWRGGAEGRGCGAPTVSASERTKRSSALRLMSVGELIPKLECSVYTTR